jgi:hypothetical protein
MILAIDPGNIESAFVFLDENLKPMDKGKIKNDELLKIINEITEMGKADMFDFAIEMVASYGMPVGCEVFDTVFWIGRFFEAAGSFNKKVRIYRKEEKINLCGTMRAKDSNIIQALKDRFGDKGTKAAPGWFYGFSKDVWQAYAVGVTYHDLYLKG